MLFFFEGHFLTNNKKSMLIEGSGLFAIAWHWCCDEPNKKHLLFVKLSRKRNCQTNFILGSLS